MIEQMNVEEMLGIVYTLVLEFDLANKKIISWSDSILDTKYGEEVNYEATMEKAAPFFTLSEIDEAKQFISMDNIRNFYDSEEKSRQRNFRKTEASKALKTEEWFSMIFRRSGQNSVFLFIREANERVQNDMLVHAVQKDYDYILSIDLIRENYLPCFRLVENNPIILKNTKNYPDDMKQYIHDYAKEEDREKMLEMMDINTVQAKLERNEIYSFAIELSEDGEIYHKMIKYFYTERSKSQILMTCIDITETVNLERRKNEMVQEAYNLVNEANQAKTEFLSRVSHDIRTPLNAIIGMSAVAGANLENPAKVKESLTKVVSASKHLLGLVNDFLDISKIESGTLSIRSEGMNFADLLQEAAAMIRPSVEQKSQKLSFAYHDVEHDDVIGDAERLSQILINLLSNAVKYTPSGGRVDVTLSELPSTIDNYGYFALTVADTGIGMSEEFLSKIFDPFVRAKDSRVDTVKGIGLGMAIVKSLVDAMHGEINVDSTLGEGTKITIKFHLELPDSNKLDVEKLNELPILIVDDEPAMCEYAATILEDIGMKCDVAFSGYDAIELVRDAQAKKDMYFAIIMDWRMPHMNGLEAVQRIRELVGFDTPIIVLTAYDWEDIEEEARAVGVNYFLSKPLNEHKLFFLFQRLVADGEKDLETGSLLNGKNILLAEDNEINREILEELLAMEGANVTTAIDGQEAVNAYKEHSGENFDCILMDVQMPLMDGYEATRAIRELEKDNIRKLPIIAVTADAFKEDVQAASHAGMDAHVPKPVDMNVLKQTLYKLWTK